MTLRKEDINKYNFLLMTLKAITTRHVNGKFNEAINWINIHIYIYERISMQQKDLNIMSINALILLSITKIILDTFVDFSQLTSS